MAACRSCKAPITWAITENGRKIPLNRGPDPAGNLTKTGATVSGLPEVHYRTRGDEDRPEETRYTAHFATCPEAARHRRSRS